jgi:uracil-DNA glycosylase family 4
VTVEIETCTPYLARQIELIAPSVIATLGNFATRYVLGTTAGITTLRGKLYHVDGRCVVPIFHPAVALYDGSRRADLQDDFKRLRAVLDREDSSTPGTADGPPVPPPSLF